MTELMVIFKTVMVVALLTALIWIFINALKWILIILTWVFTKVFNNTLEIKEDKSIQETLKGEYVYVISNRGSFGPDVYKIGATKRENPLDRIRELEDSVPFKFDVHTLIYTKDAFKLEAQLHRLLKEYTINKVNCRKKFYKVSLNTIKETVKNLGYEPEWIDGTPAIEFEKSKDYI